MEIRIIYLLAAFTYLLFYLVHKSYDGDHPTLRTIELRLLTGFFFIIFGISLISIKYLIPNGSVSSYTPITLTNNPWQKGLVAGFILFGFLQLGMAIMDAVGYRNYRRAMQEYDDEYDKSLTIEYERA